MKTRKLYASLLSSATISLLLFSGGLGLIAEENNEEIYSPQPPVFQLDEPEYCPFGTLKNGTGDLFESSFKDKEGRVIKTVTIWQEHGGDLRDPSSLSTLDAILSAQVSRFGHEKDENAVTNFVVAALYELVRVETDGVVLSERLVNELHSRLEGKVDVRLLAEIRSQSAQVIGTCGEGRWSFSLPFLKHDGSVERRTLSGALNPFGIKKSETELILRAGSIVY